MLEAETRALMGKGASRRLRRLDGKVPAVIYGGDKPSQSIQFLERQVVKALEAEKIFSSVFEIKVDGKKERVILKDVQRHPAKAIVLHMDLQRVSAKDVLVKLVPIHFINEEVSPGVKEGGVVSHTMTQVEVRCEARHLPEFIEVDLASIEMDQVLHLSNLVLPEGVELTVDLTDGEHDLPVASVHEPRVAPEPEVAEEDEASEEENTEGSEEGSSEDAASGDEAEGDNAEDAPKAE